MISARLTELGKALRAARRLAEISTMGRSDVMSGLAIWLGAIAVLQWLILLRPENAGAWTNLGLILVQLGVFCVALVITIAVMQRPIAKLVWALQASGEEATEANQELSAANKALGEQLDVALESNLNLRRQSDRGRALNERANRLVAELGNVLHEAAVVIDADLNVLLATPAAAGRLGCVLEGLRAEPLDTNAELAVGFASAEEQNELAAVARSVIKAAVTVPVREALSKKLGESEETLQVQARAILDERGGVVGAFLSIALDGENLAAADDADRLAQDVDMTTGLPMRNALARRVADLLLMGKRSGEPAEHCLCLLAPDSYQSINDEYGFRAGEELLWNFSQAARGALGHGVELYLSGTAQLALLLPFQGSSQAHGVAEALRKKLEAAEYVWDGRSYHSTATLALVEVDDSSADFSALLEQANAELHQARAAGGNRVAAVEADPLQAATRDIEAQLVGWLDAGDDAEKNRLRLYSSWMDPFTNALKPCSFAELRVEMEDGFWIEPAAFLSSAVNAGISDRVDMWLIERVVRAMSQDSALGKLDFTLVRVAGHSLLKNDFASRIIDCLRAGDLHAERISIALDARYCQQHLSRVTAFVKQLAEASVRVSVTGVKVDGFAALIESLKPRIAALHRTVTADLEAPQVQADLAYLSATAQRSGCRLWATGRLDEHRSADYAALGLSYMTRDWSGFGPLTEH